MVVDTTNYWEERYKKGGNSGAGSYGDNAKFKADFINKLVKKYNIKDCIEFGCGDGNNLALYDIKDYLGLDVSNKAIDICSEMFKNDTSKDFALLDMKYEYKADLTLSLDVTFHIFPMQAFKEYINKVVDIAEKVAIFYSFPKGDESAIHVNDYDFEGYIKELCKNKGYKLTKSKLTPPNSNSRFYIIIK